MIVQYTIFYIGVGFLMAALLNIVNIITFRTKGKVIGYQFKLGSTEYNKYRGRTGNKALLATLAITTLLVYLLAEQASAITQKHVSHSTNTLVFGSVLVILFCLWVLYRIAKTFGNSSSKRKSRSSTGKHSDDSSWPV